MSQRSLDEFAASKLEAIERRHLRRELTVTDRGVDAKVERAGKTLVSFACNDYLGLSLDPATIDASIAASRKYGVGAGASRLITGDHPLYRQLEQKLAELKGTDDAVVFGSGYLTNIGTIPLVAGRQDLIVIDEFAHSCIRAGAALSGAKTLHYKHNDVADLEAILLEQRADHRRCLVATDGVFSMEGDLAPLPKLAALTERHDAWLMSDDAHGLGVVGGGRGSTFAHGQAVRVPLQMGTLSKAVGSYGGYLCASHPVTELIRNRARSFVFSTGLPPGSIAAAIKALDIILNDTNRVALPLRHAQTFAAALDLPEAKSAIVPLILGNARAALAASDTLRQAGFLVPAIRPPSVPAGTSRLRFAFSAAHSAAVVTDLIGTVKALKLTS